MEHKHVIYEREGNFGVITLNRPERLNAVGGTLIAELDISLRQAEADPEVRVVVLTGAGRAFCAGLDLKERASGVGVRSWRKRLKGLETPRIILGMNTPIIAAVNGAAVGIGFELAMLCDYRIGSEAARMGDVHVKHGLIQDAGAVMTLPRVVGWANACKILLTGDIFEAQELLSMGVLNEVVPATDLRNAAFGFAGRIAANPPLAIGMTKRLLRMAQKADLDVTLDYSMLMMGALQQEDDYKESVQAFAERREPKRHRP
jgi:2-(1,2-epoxy-1,2-dihydrophenyl)acetyl-CoA isomerase